MPRATPHTAKSSDQMPEEAPAEQVPDDVGEADEGAARESAVRHARDAMRHRSEQSERADRHDSDRAAGRWPESEVEEARRAGRR
jgi:hypothetical protein